ncbi:fatty-acyl-CoA synthase [Humitalea rosea]|uniref:Fatty-acyl-CoA synthase n=1 Tax=Humitalea rosea TaxID=990373 RepID=A0A2W7IC25_9PROT|nr:AMP-binding protein [Humitalea rosea]PZW43112.1 fatty-acyl-CoA synthase [Humitalea rosea]
MTPSTLPAWFRQGSGCRLTSGETDWDREDLVGASLEVADRLRAEGLVVGDRVGWIGLNDVWMIAALLACARAGMVLVPLNWRLAPEELAWIAADADLRLVFRGAGVAAPRAWLPQSVALVPADLSDIELEALGGPQIGAGEEQAEAPLLLVYTSGTSGRPKGVILTQSAVVANIRNAIGLFGLTPDDHVLTVLPMFHVGGLCIQTLPTLCAGGWVTLLPRFEPAAFFEALARDRPSLTLLVPAVMRALVQSQGWPGADLSCLRAVGAGSSEVPADMIEAFQSRGVPVQQVYGATEAGPIAIAQSIAEAWAAAGSIGRPICEARVVAPDGTPLPPGATGEIELRGPNLLSGYWGQEPAATSAEGWFRTGDVGHFDADGRWWFTDRLGNVIVSGGENIYPAEVERVLATAPGVLEGAVCGRPDLKWGEVPVAVVVPGPGFDAAAVLSHFEGKLARFKKPRDVVAVASLPRNALGKVVLAELRALAGGCRATGGC